MYPSIEIRWFYPGAMPEMLAHWLAAGANRPAGQPTRRDHYLRLPGNAALGIKLREGGVEVKRREGAGRTVTLAPGVAGQAERWRKWRFPLAEGRAVAGFLAPPGDWLAVEKKRYLQRYRLEDPGGAVPIELDQGAERGCEFEISRLRAGDTIWWSVCFEAFGRESDLERSLMVVAGQVLGGDWPLPLAAGCSCGYPAWLDGLI
ncbi:MAG: hypothetical protein PVF47_05045 [Anaerolineae bacterium]|jgi:hypothetical protein